jgi:hypothetical protein
VNDRIKKLQVDFPRGAPIGSACLRSSGISNDLSAQYVRSGWIERLGRGVFMHAGDQLQLDPTLVFLESKIEGLHIAAKSALARHGYRQNLSASESIVLWGAPKGRLPDWFVERFTGRYNRTQLFSSSPMAGLCRLPESQNGPLVSEPELALLEMLSEVGLSQELNEARAILESMRHIRVKRLLQWIQCCKMVKAVRLCAYWSRELELPWAERVIDGIPDAMLRHRWTGTLGPGGTLNLPAMQHKQRNEE